MNRFSRLVACALSLSLVLASAPYEAAAQVVTGRVAPVGSIGAWAGAFNAVGASNAALPAQNLQPGLVPTLSPSATLVPTFAPAPSALRSEGFSAIAIAPSAALAAVPATVAAAPAATPLQALRTGASAVAAAAKSDSGETARPALDAMFTGAGALSALRAESLPVLSAASDSPRLDASDAQPAKGPRWVNKFRPDGTNPATSLKRTLSVGFLAAVIPIAITMGAVIVAQMLGYELHPNYQGPTGTETTNILQALAIWVGAAVMAPISEEAIFRGGMQGRLSKLSKWISNAVLNRPAAQLMSKLSSALRWGAYWTPIALVSAGFVLLHETSDPLLMATRFVHAMILGHVYAKEGILAAMAAHGFFNGLLAVSIVTAALGMPWLSLATLPLALWGVWKARIILKSQKPDITSGALAPKPMSALMAFAFVPVLLAGYFFIMPNIFWAVGAVALLIAGARKLKN